MGLGPFGLATRKILCHLNKIFLPITFTLVGYQPVGINPLIYFNRVGLHQIQPGNYYLHWRHKGFFIRSNARPLLVEPAGASGYKAALRTSRTLLFLISITETDYHLHWQQIECSHFLLNNNSLGLSPTLISAVNFLCLVSNTITLSPPQNEIYNSFLFGETDRHNLRYPGKLLNNFLMKLTTYKELFSLVTTYKVFSVINFNPCR